ncbi:uncharacterized protein LOC130726281 [Lotus japonicus]|uniref:uncharacterized protein LOC130726281 n=1 Tax=Lotus japonicus TaxID=34305 RepID=UPI00258C1C2B|nr:uncharacterized protein LOC130726281 [Lotus japonicus]
MASPPPLPPPDPLSTIADQLSSLVQQQDFHDSRNEAFTSILQHLSQQITTLTELPTTNPGQPPPRPPLGFNGPGPGPAHLHPGTNLGVPSSSSGFNLPHQPAHLPKHMKLQLIAFDGSDPLDWLFKVEQYFQFHQLPPSQRLDLMAFYMTEDALSWYKWMSNNNQLSTWEEFTRALTLRFGPSTYENHQQELFKLKQISSMAEYQKRFEKICNQVFGLTLEIMLNCFLSGLHPDINKELSILRPYSVSQAIGLAKLVESKLKDNRAFPGRFNRPGAPFSHGQPTSSSPAIRSSLPGTTSSQPAKPSSPFTIKRLTPTQMQERRALGLALIVTKNTSRAIAVNLSSSYCSKLTSQMVTRTGNLTPRLTQFRPLRAQRMKRLSSSTFLTWCSLERHLQKHSSFRAPLRATNSRF